MATINYLLLTIHRSMIITGLCIFIVKKLSFSTDCRPMNCNYFSRLFYRSGITTTQINFSTSVYIMIRNIRAPSWMQCVSNFLIKWRKMHCFNILLYFTLLAHFTFNLRHLKNMNFDVLLVVYIAIKNYSWIIAQSGKSINM